MEQAGVVEGVPTDARGVGGATGVDGGSSDGDCTEAGSGLGETNGETAGGSAVGEG